MPVYLCLQPDVPTSLAHHDAETAHLPLSRRRSGESCAPRLRLGVVSLRSVVLASVQGWGYQSPEHFSRSEWLGLPVTRSLQPVRMAGATSHPSTLADQNRWGYQSHEHFSRSESLWLPVTRTLQPIRMAVATSHPITSANQNGSGHQSPKRFSQSENQN